ncbi:uncharacterized protein LOC120198863 [Hibiscus syriacus]|uniref:uncharacterized protein LOC120198863 n=1 Tax=Hibiscus syriacus TaxID=106335 RepID=UPI0019213D21|nr:uncharacterized protein LOC120198863 [Hibiscus syriacus]
MQCSPCSVLLSFLVNPCFLSAQYHSHDQTLLSPHFRLLTVLVLQDFTWTKVSNQHCCFGLIWAPTVIALDRANAEDAALPVPKIFHLHEQKEYRHGSLGVGANDVVIDSFNPVSQPECVAEKDDSMKFEARSKTLCMEDQLKSLGIHNTCGYPLDSMLFDGINLEANFPPKKMRAVISPMEPCDAHKLLENLMKSWQSRTCSGKYVLPWIYGLLLTHGHFILPRESVTQMLNSLSKNTKSRGSALQLSGRLQLVTTQIDKASQIKSQNSTSDHSMDESEDDDDDVDDVLYGEEDESQISSDDDN